jgi:hypothetical protein
VGVCQQFWADVYGAGKSFAKSAFAPAVQRHTDAPVEEVVREWFEEHGKFFEHMPDTVGSGRAAGAAEEAAEGAAKAPATGVLLPYPFKKNVYAEFVASQGHKHFVERLGRVAGVSLTSFNRVWQRYYRHFQLRKHMRFAKCDDCVRLRALLNDRSQTPAQRTAHQQEHRAHVKFVRGERSYYHAKRNKAAASAANNPDTLSIIFDGADQGAYGPSHNRL